MYTFSSCPDLLSERESVLARPQVVGIALQLQAMCFFIYMYCYMAAHDGGSHTHSYGLMALYWALGGFFLCRSSFSSVLGGILVSLLQ